MARSSRHLGNASILTDASPEAAAGGGLALLKTGDRVRIDLNKGTANILVSKAELARRRAALEKNGGLKYPPSQTPWQEIYRSVTDQLGDGMVLKPAVKYQRVAQTSGIPRDTTDYPLQRFHADIAENARIRRLHQSGCSPP